MTFRACKHILRKLIHGLTSEHSASAVSHFLNCLLGTEKNPEPSPDYQPFSFREEEPPLYTKLTPESLRAEISKEVATRFRWRIDQNFLTGGIRKPQLLRELAMRTAFQLDQRTYDFTGVADEESLSNSVELAGKGKKGKKTKVAGRSTTFEPSDIITLLPVIRSTAPTVSSKRHLPSSR